MGKNKLARWKELGTFINVIQPGTSEVIQNDHPIRGKWNRELFGNENPIVLELGCGKGEYTVAMSAIFPAKNYIGIDIKGARMWRGAKTANDNGTRNAAFLRTRIEFIDRFFKENEVDEIWITFPDPHPGKRNSNKRLTCPWFLNKYRLLIKDGGTIHLKTDNRDLYDYTRTLVMKNNLEILYDSTDLYGLQDNCSKNNLSANIPENILSIRTHYESIFLKEGLKINYLAFRIDKSKIIRDEWQQE